MKRILAALVLFCALLYASTSMANEVKMTAIGEMRGEQYYLCDDTLVVYKEYGSNIAQMWVFVHDQDANLAKYEPLDEWILYEIVPGQRVIREIERLARLSDGHTFQNNYADMMATNPANSSEYKFAATMSQWSRVVPGSMVEVIYNSIIKTYNKR